MATATSTTTSQLDPQVSGILDQILKSQQMRSPLATNMILGAMKRLNMGVSKYPAAFDPTVLEDYSVQGRKGIFPFDEFFSTGLTPPEEDVLARNAQRGVSDVLESTPSRGGALETNLRNAMINSALTRSSAASQARQLGLERAASVAGANVPIPGLPRTAVSSSTRTRMPTPTSLSGIGQLLGLGSSSGLFGSIGRGLSGLFGSGSSSGDLGPALDLLNPGAGTLFGDTGGGGIFDNEFDFGF